jgi:hypothetical protein
MMDGTSVIGEEKLGLSFRLPYQHIRFLVKIDYDCTSQ